MLNTWDLGKIIEGKAWPSEILDMLKGFVRWEELKRLYPAKR
jgi:hypothetical protein